MPAFEQGISECASGSTARLTRRGRLYSLCSKDEQPIVEDERLPLSAAM